MPTSRASIVALGALVFALGACSSSSSNGVGSSTTTTTSACGALSQSCCSGDSCTGGLRCRGYTCEVACGEKGEPCCGGDCSSGTCRGGTCACGAVSDPCCSGHSCDPGAVCASDEVGISNSCYPCGELGQRCCADDACTGGLACGSSYQAAGLGKVCGYAKAELYLYYCPDFLAQGCSSPAYYSVGDVCTPAPGGFQPGQWYDSGITLDRGQTYSYALCRSLQGNNPCGDCGGAGHFVAPGVFLSQKFCSSSGAGIGCNSSQCAAPACPP